MTPFTLDASVDVLARTPAVLRTQLAGLDERWTHANYGPDTFSPFDVVGHLIHADRTNWLPRLRLRLILEHGESTPLPAFDRYAMFHSSRGRSLDELLETFAQVRAENLDALRAMRLTDEQLDRRGAHPQLGPVTARNLIASWVVHDLGHTHQIVKSMAFQYRDAVGPWRELLTILPRQ